MKSEPRFEIFWRGKRYGTAFGKDAAAAVQNWLAKYPEEYRPHFKPEDVKAVRCGR